MNFSNKYSFGQKSKSTHPFFKITNKDENHHGFQYCDGLNVLKEEFAETGTCCAGGFYFTDIDHILEFLDYGEHLRLIALPKNDSDFKMVADGPDKQRANKIILGKKYDLDKVETWKFLKKCGAKFDIDNVIPFVSKNGYIDVLKYLVKLGIDIHAKGEYAIILASENGHVDIVRFLTRLGINVSAWNDAPIRYASRNGHVDVVRFLAKAGADIHTCHGWAIAEAACNGHIEVVCLLNKLGAKIDAYDDYGLYARMKFFKET